MKHTILHADVMDGLRSLPDRSVHCVITSPPYWGLRDYGVEGQIGLEPTPGEYVARLVEVFREVRRVLRDDGTLWLNLGDSFASKNLAGIPWRVAFALQEDGWYLRSDIIWHKPNSMPESVRDRPTKAHEYMFLLTKSRRYYYDADAVREPCTGAGWERSHADRQGHGNGETGADVRFGNNPAGRNRRDVWTIPTRPYKGAHFATFPPALVEPCIKAGTSERGCCPECGAPWVREVVREHVGASIHRGAYLVGNGRGSRGSVYAIPRESAKVISSGWQPSCACGTGETVPCIVLDPFGGSGTVAKVAKDLGRSSISCELNPEYVEIAKKRLRIGEQLDSGVCAYEVRSLLREV